jgi:hypothetical protein
MSEFEAIAQKAHLELNNWIDSCTRAQKIARNTVAIGIVVFHHMRQGIPVPRELAISKGGEVKGVRKGSLGKILRLYDIPEVYLKEATTRQGPQDGRRLFEAFEWGNLLTPLTEGQQDALLIELIGVLKTYAFQWLDRQNLKLAIDRRESPTAWVESIIESAKSLSGGVVEQHLVGAKLARRHQDIEVPNHPAHAADLQTARSGDFSIKGIIYHVTATPSRGVMEKCIENVKAGLKPVLLVPRETEYRAKALAQEEKIDKSISIISIEAFVALNIIELAIDSNKDFFRVLEEIIDTYNQRLAEVETDLSLKIEVK